MNKSKEILTNTIVSKLWTDYNLKPGFDIEKLVTCLDISYKHLEFEEKISGLFISTGSKKIIFVNQKESPQRQRFSAAHELGHYYLHHQDSLSINKNIATFLRDSSSSSGQKSIEVEANFFAATLLMPISEIQIHLEPQKDLEENTETLSKIFNVSAIAMGIRLNSIGYIWA